jgi:hypothetical protein
VGSERHENLCTTGEETHGEGGQEKGHCRAGQSCSGETKCGSSERQKNQATIFDEIGQRNQEQQSGAIAELRYGNDKTGHAAMHIEIGADEADKRLRIVNITDHRPAGEREQKGQCRGKPRHFGCDLGRFRL